MRNLLLLCLCLPTFVWGQKSHKVGPKETIYSIGRLYNVHPRELAQYNGLSISDGLKIEQVLKIPTKTTMAPLPSTSSAPSTSTAPVVDVVKTKPAENKKSNAKPIYHTVQKKETLFQIKRTYPGVSIDDLKKWNKLESDGLSEGMKLIVGYTSSDNTPQATTTVVNTKSEPIASEQVVVEQPKKNQLETTVTEKPKNVEANKLETPTKNDAIKQNTEVPVKETLKTASAVTVTGDGYFKSQFNQRASMNQESGTAGAFKSTSGWEDGKYYCLHNSASAGTIMQITNPLNGKSIFAKVLDVIPDIPQNKGLIVRLSNASASALGVDKERFEVNLVY